MALTLESSGEQIKLSSNWASQAVTFVSFMYFSNFDSWLIPTSGPEALRKSMRLRVHSFHALQVSCELGNLNSVGT